MKYTEDTSASTEDMNTLKMQKCCSRKQTFLPIVIYILYIIGSLIVPADGKVSWSSGRRRHVQVIDTDIEVAVDPMPVSKSSSPAEHNLHRRRPRRSTSDHDFVAFRKFLHNLRTAGRGARLDFSSVMRRDSIATISERASTGNMIANKVKCGGCQLTKQWIPVSKPGCRTNFVLAPTCMGMCETWEIPDVNPPFIKTNHRVCRPTKIEFRKIRLRRCNPGVNAYHVVPVAQNCTCMKCKSRNTACRPLL
ncbi:uncharacterized protein LOC120326698 [Styela clava]